MPEVIAVLTGDVVRSSSLAPGALDRAVAALDAAAAEAAGWTGAPSRFTRFRGDGWQCLAPAPALWLRSALLLKARLRALGRGFDTRIAVGIGTGTLPGGDDLAAASGPAFRTAGHLLDRMPRSRSMAVGWPEPPVCEARTDAILALCDALARRWTPAAAPVFAALLGPEPPARTEAAAVLGITPQMVAKHLRLAGEPALRIALAAVEADDAG